MVEIVVESWLDTGRKPIAVAAAAVLFVLEWKKLLEEPAHMDLIVSTFNVTSVCM